MKIKTAKLINGLYSWDNPITKEQWILMLQDKSLITEASKSTLYKFYLEPGHRSTCQKLGEKHNIESNVIHKNISNIGRSAQAKLNEFEVIGPDKQPTHWIIPMYGQLSNRVLEWVIRPELTAAMETLYVNGDPTKDRETTVTPKSINSIKQTLKEKTKTNFSVQEYVELLKTSKNLVLTGIIGTGKTYLAKKIAKTMEAETKIVRFHDAYSYSDFIGGFRHTTFWDNYESKETLYDGDFTAFCKEALQNLIDSQKTKEELEEYSSIYQTMIFFVKTIENKIFEDGEFLLDNDTNFKGIAITDISHATLTVTSKAGGSATIPWEDMLSLIHI